MDIASLVYDVSKDLYSFCQKAKGREDDIKDIRAQLLWMGEKSVLVQEVLQRDGFAVENKSKVEDNMQRCKIAVIELRDTVARLKPAKQDTKGSFASLQARMIRFGLMTAWPFKKDTILALADYVKNCHSALDAAISLLHLNVSASLIEDLRKTDKLILGGKKSLEDAFKELRSSVTAQLHRISERLAEQSKLLLEQQNRQKAQQIIENLRYTELEDRELQITELDDESYAWIFTPEAQGIAEAQNLVRFLNVESGLFWISGEAASGKSTLMKFIARSPLWQWQGQKNVTTACHFCWIAGTAAQKTQISMLRTLLYYILVAEPEIVPDVCHNAWNSGVGCSPQSVRELRQCLHTAVNVTKRRHCLFVDGLDELQPEDDHSSVVGFLEQMSMHGHAKIIASSRPWTAFESHQSASNKISMANINTKAIAKYLQSTIGSLSELRDVSWPCQNGSLRCKHDSAWDTTTHGDAHELIYDLICKAQGNFLWTCLVAKSTISRSSAAFSMAFMKKYVDETPSDLNLYFRNMIIERIGQEWRSETAMALSVAQSFETPWTGFWLLLNSLDGGLPSLESPDFALATPYQEYDIESFRTMMQRTSNFLSTCCRDVLDTGKVRRMIRTLGESSTKTRDEMPWSVIAGTTIPFTHRTIFDYLKTREMSELLNKHTPRGFHDINFHAKLMIAEAKISYRSRTCTAVPTDGACTIWTSLDSALGIWIEKKSPKDECTLARYAKEADDIALHYLLEDSKSIFDNVTYSQLSRRTVWPLPSLCSGLAHENCYSTIDALLEQLPEPAFQEEDGIGLCLLQYALNNFSSMRFLRRNPVNTGLLKRLLIAGIYPNRPRLLGHHRWSTPWCEFLDTLALNEESSRTSGTSILSTVRTPQSSSHVIRETFATPHIQTAIEYLLEYGAELELSTQQPSLQGFDRRRGAPYQVTDSDRLIDARIDPLVTLRAWLPMDEGSKWPRLLESYLQPKKREEIRETRQRIVDNWPKASGA